MKVASFLVVFALLTGLAAGSGATQAIRVPPGFRVDVFAQGLSRPTAMVFAASSTSRRREAKS